MQRTISLQRPECRFRISTEDEEDRPILFYKHNNTAFFEQLTEVLNELWQTSDSDTVYDPNEAIRELRKRVVNLELKLSVRPRITRGDRAYEALRSSLEKEHFDRIVAIDTERKEVAGIGDTILQAYEQAKAKFPDKKQFYFRRVGKTYVERVR